MLQEGVADPSGFPAAGRTRDQPGVLHGQRATGHENTSLGMGIILIMPDQMTLVIESSVEMNHGTCASCIRGRFRPWALLVCPTSGFCWMRGRGGSAQVATDDEPIAQICQSSISCLDDGQEWGPLRVCCEADQRFCSVIG